MLFLTFSYFLKIHTLFWLYNGNFYFFSLCSNHIQLHSCKMLLKFYSVKWQNYLFLNYSSCIFPYIYKIGNQTSYRKMAEGLIFKIPFSTFLETSSQQFILLTNAKVGFIQIKIPFFFSFLHGNLCSVLN